MGGHNCYQEDVTECIRKKAYELWEKEGRKKDSDLHYWLAAENSVKPGVKKRTPRLESDS